MAASLVCHHEGLDWVIIRAHDLSVIFPAQLCFFGCDLASGLAASDIDWPMIDSRKRGPSKWVRRIDAG
jgi:hypothetical protein